MRCGSIGSDISQRLKPASKVIPFFANCRNSKLLRPSVLSIGGSFHAQSFVVVHIIGTTDALTAHVRGSSLPILLLSHPPSPTASAPPIIGSLAVPAIQVPPSPTFG